MSEIVVEIADFGDVTSDDGINGRIDEVSGMIGNLSGKRMFDVEVVVAAGGGIEVTRDGSAWGQQAFFGEIPIDGWATFHVRRRIPPGSMPGSYQAIITARGDIG